MNVTLAICWSILYNDKFKIEVVSYWLISNIGKYVPFKLGLIPKRFIYSKIYSNNKSFSKFFIIEYLYMTLIFFILTLIGLSQYRLWIILTVFTIFVILKKKINRVLVFLYTLAFLLNFLAISIFYFSIFEVNSIIFTSNYILSAIVGNLFIGSPAGIGIREAIFVNNPFTNFDGKTIVSIIFTLRFLYIVSDFISYSFGVLLKVFSDYKND
jgi:uncharacterized membrane protein YbhN (UPF0104 family)